MSSLPPQLDGRGGGPGVRVAGGNRASDSARRGGSRHVGVCRTRTSALAPPRALRRASSTTRSADAGFGRRASTHSSGSGTPPRVAGPVEGHVDHERRPRGHRRRLRVVDRPVGRLELTQPDQARRRGGAPTVPPLTRRRAHLLGDVVEERLDLRAAVLERQFEASAQEPVVVTPLPQRPSLTAAQALLAAHRRAAHAPGAATPSATPTPPVSRDLGIAVLVRELGGGRELLRARASRRARHRRGSATTPTSAPSPPSAAPSHPTPRRPRPDPDATHAARRALASSPGPAPRGDGSPAPPRRAPRWTRSVSQHRNSSNRSRNSLTNPSKHGGTTLIAGKRPSRPRNPKFRDDP